MTIYYAKVRVSDNAVISVIARSNVFVSTDPELLWIEITQAQYNSVENSGLLHEGSQIYKYMWNGSGFSITTDTRPLVTFTPATIKTEIGDVVSVQIDISSGITQLVELLIDGVPTRINFVAGTGTVEINTTSACSFTVRSQPNYKAVTPLNVTVFTRKFGNQSNY